MRSKLIPVIINGGSSSRSFPLARTSCPKPFLELVNCSGNPGGSLFYNTLKRCLLLNIKEIYTVTLQSLYDRTAEEFAKLPKKDYDAICKHFILESAPNDTAAAFGSAIIDIYNTNPEHIMLIMPSDHVIENTKEFIRVVNSAKSLAKNDKIAIFGIKPTEPDTGYGYIAPGDHIQDTIFEVKQFKEKPDLVTAIDYVDDGYLWNSGIVCAKAKVLYDSLIKFEQNLTNELINLNTNAYRSPTSLIINYPDDFKYKMPFDIAVLERADNLAVVACNDLQFSDVGTWGSVAKYHIKDNKNFIVNNKTDQLVYTNESARCYINNASSKKLISVIGLSNLIIIDTPDSLVIASASHTNDIKHIVNDLKKRNNSILQEHSEPIDLIM